MATVNERAVYEEGWPVADELLKDLPSNQLQSHDRVKYVGDTLYPSKEGGGAVLTDTMHSPDSY